MEPDKQLLERCLQRQPEAQEELYRLYAPRMYGICLRYSGHTLEAEDILQEGFIRMFQSLHQFRHRGSFEGWLRKIFINTAISLIRSEAKFTGHESPDQALHSTGGDVDGLSRLRLQDLLKLIRNLAPGYRMVFNLFVVEGYTHREISRLLNISVNTSKSQLSGAKRILREQLTKAGHEERQTRS